MLAFPYVCIGIGTGAFGHGMGNIVSYKAMKQNPDLQKQAEINRNDERNVAIANRSKAKAYDLMTFVFGALIMSFALMGVEVTALLLSVFVYLFVQGYAIYYRCKYEKEM
jgi:alpha/beta superfamily hydrolase